MYESLEEGRASIIKALNRCEFNSAFNKIEEIINDLQNTMKELKDYQYKVGSKSDNNQVSSKM